MKINENTTSDRVLQEVSNAKPGAGGVKEVPEPAEKTGVSKMQ